MSSTTPRRENIFLMPSMGLRRLNLGAALFMVNSPRVWAMVKMIVTPLHMRSIGRDATRNTPQAWMKYRISSPASSCWTLPAR